MNTKETNVQSKTVPLFSLTFSFWLCAKNTTEMLIYALLNTFLQEKLAVLHALVMFTVFKKKKTLMRIHSTQLKC